MSSFLPRFFVPAALLQDPSLSISPRNCPLQCHCGPLVKTNLVAPYCAIPRDYLSDTPLLRAMGFLVSQHSQKGAIPPPPFLSVSPLGEHAKWGCDTPPLQRGISAILARYPMKTRQMGAIPPSAILSRKGIARYGGVSRTGPLRRRNRPLGAIFLARLKLWGVGTVFPLFQ